MWPLSLEGILGAAILPESDYGTISVAGLKSAEELVLGDDGKRR